ncbi:hypothetical protein ERJ75_000237300 [Trypanosoma vivax]|nr:hypothetical protein ERJ75_000237300 [Trypanosoma vivax]
MRHCPTCNGGREVSLPVLDRHLTRCHDGQLCMTVVDPATRKLLIPLEYIYVTRAQQRSTIPSLCQLFLQGRCRQGAQCHQVHAPLEIVSALRSQVETLPWCCAEHGDRDYAGVLNEQSWVSRVVVHIADVQYEGGYIPLSRFSYTLPVSKLLGEYGNRLEPDEGGSGGGGDSSGRGKQRVILNALDMKICNLHVFDRCRYAEECIFLHVCKKIVDQRPQTSLEGDKAGVPAPKKHSVFLSVSRRQMVRGNPLYYTTNHDSKANIGSLLSHDSSFGSTWQAGSMPSSWPPGSQAPATRMLVPHSLPPSLLTHCPDSDFHFNNDQQSDVNAHEWESCPCCHGSGSVPGTEMTLLNGSVSLRTGLMRVPKNNVKMSSCGSNYELDDNNDLLSACEPPLTPSPDTDVTCSAPSRSFLSKHHWRHNPYSTGVLLKPGEDN